MFKPAIALLALLLAGPALADPVLPETAPIPTPRPEAPKVVQQKPPCGQWKVIRNNLQQKMKAVEVAGGILNDDTTTTTMVAPDGKFAVYALTISDGIACYMYEGTDWFSIASHKQGRQA